jgi:hypothetical protein
LRKSAFWRFFQKWAFFAKIGGFCKNTQKVVFCKKFGFAKISVLQKSAFFTKNTKNLCFAQNWHFCENQMVAEIPA